MIFRQLFHQETCTYTYLLADELSREAVLIDPVIESVERDLRLLDELGLKLVYSLDTHVHADHITASGLLRERTGACSGVAAQAGVACADQQLAHGDRLAFGRYELEVRSTPGHTAGCVTYVLDEGSKMMAFTGDALLVRGCGRTDFQQGDAATLYRSVHDQIYSLPADAVIYPGHDYKGHTSSTVAEEWQHNPRLNRKVDQGAFVELMDQLKLAHPKHIHEALPANIACGIVRTPPPTEPATVQEINAADEPQLQNRLVIDVRSPEEFNGPLGHLPGAISAPLNTLNVAASLWQRHEPIAVVCHSGSRSAQGCQLLVEMGFTDVANVAGGMNAWTNWQELTS